MILTLQLSTTLKNQLVYLYPKITYLKIATYNYIHFNVYIIIIFLTYTVGANISNKHITNKNIIIN